MTAVVQGDKKTSNAILSLFRYISSCNPACIVGKYKFHNCAVQIYIFLLAFLIGPLDMSPVKISDISPRLSFLCIKKYRCAHMGSRAGPVTEISVFATEISVTGMKIFPYEHSSPVTGTKLFKQNSFAPTT